MTAGGRGPMVVADATVTVVVLGSKSHAVLSAPADVIPERASAQTRGTAWLEKGEPQLSEAALQGLRAAAGSRAMCTDLWGLGRFSQKVALYPVRYLRYVSWWTNTGKPP